MFIIINAIYQLINQWSINQLLLTTHFLYHLQFRYGI